MGNGNGSKVSYKELYTLVDEKIEGVNESIVRLEGKFDALEAGRLSRLESSFAELQGRIFAGVAVITFAISLGVSFILK